MFVMRTFFSVLLVASFASAQPAEPDPDVSPEPAAAEPEAEPAPPPPALPPASQPPAAQPAPAEPVAQPVPAAPGAQPTEPPPWQPPPEAELQPYTRRPIELYVGFGAGHAMCDSDEVDSQCPASGGVVPVAGGGWRFHPNFSVGIEVASWIYRVRDGWEGKLDGEPSDTNFTSSYIAAYGRWYWLDRHIADPYIVVGFGGGVMRAEAENARGRYKFVGTGAVLPIGIGVEWQVLDFLRIGPQFLAYAHASARICESPPDPGEEECRSPTENEDDEREGLAMPYRAIAVASFTLGRP
jgi:hypothetical protein